MKEKKIFISSFLYLMFDLKIKTINVNATTTEKWNILEIKQIFF
jgi:hypothetical protein